MGALSRRSPAVRSTCGLFVTALLVALCSLEAGSDMFSNWNPQPQGVEDYVEESGGGFNYKYETITMKDGKCPLDVTGTYPYLVKVFGVADKKVHRNGAILSHLCVLTTLIGQPIKIDDLIVAQRVFNIQQKRFKSCYQTRKIKKIITHPKYQEQLYDQTFNFAILVLYEQFDASNDFMYPVIPINKSPYEYSQLLRRVITVQQDYAGCEIPHLVPRDKVVSYIDVTDELGIRMYGDECNEAYCRGFSHPRKCIENRKASRNYTMICVRPKPLDDYYSPKYEDLLGAPMICNGSTVGIASWYTPVMEFVTVSTFLKIWPWMMTYKDMMWNRTFNRKSWDSVYIEDHKLFFKAISRHVPNKNITKAKRRIKFIKRLRGRSQGNCLEYSFTFYSTMVLSTVILFKSTW